MSTNNPNRNRNQSADHVRYKQSGDQHLVPEGESLQTPTAHRISREDMQKFSLASPSDTDDLQQ